MYSCEYSQFLKLLAVFTANGTYAKFKAQIMLNDETELRSALEALVKASTVAFRVNGHTITLYAGYDFR